jgi:hypothetical protein
MKQNGAAYFQSTHVTTAVKHDQHKPRSKLVRQRLCYSLLNQRTDDGSDDQHLDEIVVSDP